MDGWMITVMVDGWISCLLSFSAPITFVGGGNRVQVFAQPRTCKHTKTTSRHRFVFPMLSTHAESHTPLRQGRRGCRCCEGSGSTEER